MRRTWRGWVLGVVSVGLGAVGPAWAGHVDVLTLEDAIINPVTAEYVVQGIERAEQEHAECLILRLDTPGGLLSSTRAIVKAELNADVPIVVYVAPAGARAASAGAFLMLASHVAAMAPSTTVGAAHPVEVGGEDRGLARAIRELARALRREDTKDPDAAPPSSPARQGRGGPPPTPADQGARSYRPEDPEDVMAQKLMSDTLAWVTAIAEARGRRVDWAIRAVEESISSTDREAVEWGVADVVAPDLPHLLEQLEGREVSVASGTRVLRTREAEVRERPMTTRQHLLHVLINPNIAYILMALGFYGLLFEFTHPGVGFPGVAGAICLILAFYAFQTLPTNYAGLALIGVGIVLLVAEVKVASHGLLGLGGVATLVLGSVVLFDSRQAVLRVSLSLILPMAAATAAITLGLAGAAVRAHRRRVVTGAEGLVGSTGTARTRLAPTGWVLVHGEQWRARAATPIEAGAPVRVVRVDGLDVTVERVS